MAKNGSMFPQAGNDFHKSNGTDTLVRFEGPSLTRQEFAEECDINNLMKRYEGHNTGPSGLPRMPEVQPFYVDFGEMPTNLMDYMAMMKQAEESFMTLPAAVRKEMDNSPMNFINYASDVANLEQMRKWGLAPPEKVPDAPMRVQVVPDPSSAPKPAGDAPPPAGGSTHTST